MVLNYNKVFKYKHRRLSVTATLEEGSITKLTIMGPVPDKRIPDLLQKAREWVNAGIINPRIRERLSKLNHAIPGLADFIYKVISDIRMSL
jgi:hypothetical protein